MKFHYRAVLSNTERYIELPSLSDFRGSRSILTFLHITPIWKYSKFDLKWLTMKKEM